MDNYEDRVRVYNEGVLVAVSSKDGKTLDLLEGTPERLVPFSIFGDIKNRDNKVPFYSYFVSYWLRTREYPRNRDGADKLARLHGVNSIWDHAVMEQTKYKVFSDKIEVIFP